MDLTNNNTELPIFKNKSIMDIDGEVWRNVVGYDGEYMVSNYGRVKGLERLIKGGNGGFQKLRLRIMSQGINGTGYCALRRVFTFNGKCTNLVHRIVALSFIGTNELCLEINHKNGIKTDNRVENLEWCTRSENLKHACGVLGLNSGTKHFRSKLSEKDVKDIFYSTQTQRQIASQYGITHSVVGFIKRRASYILITKAL